MQSFFGLILTIGLVGLIVGIIVSLVNLIKKRNNKRGLLVIGSAVIIIILGVIGLTVSTPTDSKTTSKEDTSASKTRRKDSSEQKTKSSVKDSSSKTKTTDSNKNASYDEWNKQINDSLKMDKGFGEGSLDSSGNPTENGTPNPEFKWALSINDIKYTGDYLIIDVNDDFLSLDKEEATEDLNYAQNAAYSVIGDKENWDGDKYSEGLQTQVDNSSNTVATTKILNSRQFKWK